MDIFLSSLLLTRTSSYFGRDRNPNWPALYRRHRGRISFVIAVRLKETLKINRISSEPLASEFRRLLMRLSLAIAVRIKTQWLLGVD
jgi:hypothetical protein